MMSEIHPSYERIIRTFPAPYVKKASPYTTKEFGSTVRSYCADEAILMEASVKVAKVVILGDVGTGKTSLVKRFVHQCFSNNYKATIGVDFEVERFDILDMPFNLQIWDTAGQERFRCIAASYYRGAHAVVLVCDFTNISTLSHATQWLEDAKTSNRGGDLVVLLVCNKRDAVDEALFDMVESRACQLAGTIGAEYWPVSAKTGHGVTDLFRRLAALTFTNIIGIESALAEQDKQDTGIKISDDLIVRERPKSGCDNACPN